MKNTKRFLWKTRRLFAAVFALIMVLGIVQVSALPTQAAPDNELIDGVDNVYKVQWRFWNDPINEVRVHYVDEEGTPINVGRHHIDSSRGDVPDNVKRIIGGDDGTWKSEELSADGKTLWGFDLLWLVNTTYDPDINYNEYSDYGYESGKIGKYYDDLETYYNEAFVGKEFKRAYIIDGQTGQKEFINPMIFSLESDSNAVRYSKTWSTVPYGGNVSEEEFNRTSPLVPEGGLDIYLIYGEQTGPTPVLDTVSNSEIGLEMYMFDYEGMWGNDGWTQADPNFGLYEDTLKGGFPVYKNGDRNLKEFFDPKTSVHYQGTADKLFQLNDDGLYYYNSAWNAAYYNETNGEFTIYKEQTAQRSDNLGIFARTAWKKGNFYPYNKIDINKIASTNIDEDHNGVSVKGMPVYGVEPVEGAPNRYTDDVNEHFGMYMVGTIFQPEGGQSVVNEWVEDEDGNRSIQPKTDPETGNVVTQDMKFNIRGDDDILVYIDDVLVVDLGGIHDPLEGNIDFATGVITIKDGEGNVIDDATSTLKDKLIDKGVVNGHKLTGEDFKNNTFLDYSIHTIKIFYDERGGGASNLWIEMNTPKSPTLPVKNSFWLDNKEDPGNYTKKFNKMDTNINNAQYILEELVNVDGYDSYEVKLVDEDDNVQTITTPISADGVSYPLDSNKKYHIEFTGYKNGNPTTITSGEIVGSTTQNKINLNTETIEGKTYLVYNVQTVSYGGDFEKNADKDEGSYEFKNLDYTKKYRVVQQLYTLGDDGKIHPADGSSGDYPYEFTDLVINDTTPTKERLAKRVVSHIIGFLDDSNVLHYPEVEFKNVYTEVTLTKKINVKGTDQDHATVSDGGDVIYDIQSYIPNYENYPEDAKIVYQIYDEPDNRLTYNLTANDFATVKVGGTTLTRDTDYVVSEKNDAGKTYIVLTLEEPENYPNKNINVTYKMTYYGDDDTPIENIAFTKFTLTPNAENGDPNATGNSNKDEAIAYTFDFAIRKTGTTVNAAQNTTEQLAGAGFTLYKDSVSEANKIGDEKFTTATDNTIFTGLAEGDYILKETTVPDGYDALTDPKSEHNVKITPTYGNDGKIVSYTVTLDGTRMVYTAEYDNDGEFVRYTTDNGQNAFTIENTKTLGSIRKHHDQQCIQVFGCRWERCNGK